VDGKRSHASTMNRFLFIFLFSSPTCMKLIGLVVDGKKKGSYLPGAATQARGDLSPNLAREE